MTTIAFDGRYVAADTLRMCGDIIMTDKVSKLRADFFEGRYYLYALTGNPAMLGPWIRFHQGETKKPPEDDSNLIVFTKSCEWRMFAEHSWDPPWHKEHHAWGSGYIQAITAMDCGKNAISAIELTAKRDPYTSIDNGIAVFDLVEWMFIK